MGCVFSKPKNSDDLRDLTIAQKSSCDLTEFWNVKKQDFLLNYFNNHKALIAKSSDFRVTTLLGEGAYGSVTLSTHKKTGETFATKVIAKKKIVKKKLVERTYCEKRILESIDFPFVVKLEYFYQDHSFLYFVMPFICGGDIFTHIKRYGPMDEEKARFYIAEVILAAEYLHRLDLIHRDIKPENILIDAHGHAQLADFGFCKYTTGRTYTLCGTPEYMAPEIILRKGYGKAVDYWAIGVLLYEMMSGHSPFIHRDIDRIFNQIVNGKYSFPIGFSGELMNLLRNLLKVDVTKRYGNLVNGIRDIKKHQWFQSIDWCALFDKKIIPPFVPTVDDIEDTSNFEKLKGKIFLAASEDHYNEEFENF